MVRYREDLRRELDALRKKAESVFRPGARPRSADPGTRSERALRREARAAVPSGPLSDLVRGEEVASAGGRFYRVLAEGGAIWEDTAQFHREYLEALAVPFPPEAPQLEPLVSL